MKGRTTSLALLPLLLLLVRHTQATTDTADQDEIDFRIVGGEEAYANEFPWFASSTSGSLCGASLISPHVLLTAAHCARAFQQGETVIVKAYRFQSSMGGAIRRTIGDTLSHPNYGGKFGSNKFEYDFMLVQLDEPITDITPVQLNRDIIEPIDDRDVTVMGFGTTSEGGSISRRLLKVDLKKTPLEECKEVYGGSYDDRVMLCADEEDKDSCQGDSG